MVSLQKLGANTPQTRAVQNFEYFNIFPKFSSFFEKMYGKKSSKAIKTGKQILLRGGCIHPPVQDPFLENPLKIIVLMHDMNDYTGLEH